MSSNSEKESLTMCPDCNRTDTTLYFEQRTTFKYYAVNEKCEKTDKEVKQRKGKSPLEIPLRTGLECQNCGYFEYDDE